MLKKITFKKYSDKEFVVGCVIQESASVLDGLQRMGWVLHHGNKLIHMDKSDCRITFRQDRGCWLVVCADIKNERDAKDVWVCLDKVVGSTYDVDPTTLEYIDTDLFGKDLVEAIPALFLEVAVNCGKKYDSKYFSVRDAGYTPEDIANDVAYKIIKSGTPYVGSLNSLGAYVNKAVKNRYIDLLSQCENRDKKAKVVSYYKETSVDGDRILLDELVGDEGKLDEKLHIKLGIEGVMQKFRGVKKEIMTLLFKGFSKKEVVEMLSYQDVSLKDVNVVFAQAKTMCLELVA